MTESKNTEKLTREDETRAAKIARVAARLPEKEQEKVYYMLKGIELAGSTRITTSQAAAV